MWKRTECAGYCDVACISVADIGIYSKHIAEATLVDDGNCRVVAEDSSQLVYVSVKGIAVSRLGCLPSRQHEFRSRHGPSKVCCQKFKNLCLEICQLGLLTPK